MSHCLFVLGQVRKNGSFRGHMTRAARLLMVLVIALSLVGGSAIRTQAATTITFTAEELLGRPTDTSVTINIVPASTIEYHYQYGTAPGDYDFQTATVTATGGQPHEITISGLAANTKYYYRMRYHLPGETDWVERTEHSFRTQRDEGSTFVFDVTSDSHVNIMLGSRTTWAQTLTRVAADQPDFLIDLGDTFAMDNVSTAADADAAYLFQRSSDQLGAVSHSVPIFLAPGNHEQQEAWHLSDTGSPPVIGTNAQKKFFLNPVPDAFYSGNTDNSTTALDGDHLKEDYYAWTWGDALFVVIDPFWYTEFKPFAGNTGGGEPGTSDGDRWHWTLGQQQYNWLKQTLQNSGAAYKFIFAHHMVGGSQDYVREGANATQYCEWGGYNEAGTTYEWDTKRAGWGSDPVHDILVDNGVNAFFHGHDHQYAYEERDGVVYQALPAAGFSGSGFNLYSSGDRYTIQALPSPGHLRVTVTPEQATVDYIATTSGAVNYSYTIEPNYSGPTQVLTTAVDPSGGGTISPSAGPHTYPQGQVVNVTATPNTGYAFDHWSGDCTGSGACEVTMSVDRSVTAHFTPATYNLTLAVNPSNAGTTVPDAGVHNYPYGTVVSITASPLPGFAFSSWTGCSSSTTTCSVTMTSDKSVTANFTAVSGNVTSAATPDASTVPVGGQVVVSININMTGSAAPNNALGGFTGSLAWNPAVLQYASHTGPLGGFTGAVNTGGAASGQLVFNGINASGATGNTVVLQITFNALAGGTSGLNLEYSEMAAAVTFANLLPLLAVTDGQVAVSQSGVLGDVNRDGQANSTDALIVMSAEVNTGTSQYCPMNCGDANGDGTVNSTDALIILSFDAGMTVPFPLETGACPAVVTQPPVCVP